MSIGAVSPYGRPFYNPCEFEFLKEVQSNWKEIYQEFKNLEQSEFHPWPESGLFRSKDRKTKELQPGVGWNVFGLYAFNTKKTENCLRCPLTTSLIEAAVNPPMTAAFSILRPGAHILPHSGYLGYSDSVLRVHICLEAPKNCIGENSQLYHDQSFYTDEISEQEWFEKSICPFDLSSERQGCMFRAETECTTWRPGHMLVFDDTSTHEAWNHTDERRVILLFDFERPKKYMITDEDMAAVEEMERNHPFSNGGRGNTYLDRLTRQHGWEKLGED